MKHITRMTHRHLITALCALGLALATFAAAGEEPIPAAPARDWPNWRGPVS